VIGKTDATASAPTTKVFKPTNLFSTVMHHLFDLGKLRLRSDVHRDIKAAVENHAVIDDLF